MCGEELVGWLRATAGVGAGEVEEVFEEDFYSWETGCGCCLEFGGEVVHPGSL